MNTCGWLDRLVILYNPLEAIVFDIIFLQKKKIIHVCFGHETNGLMGKGGEHLLFYFESSPVDPRG